MADREAVDERISSVEVREPTEDDEGRIIVDLRDGRRVSVPLCWSWRLEEATAEERQNFHVSPSEYLIRWPDVDEDLSSSGLLRGAPATPPKEIEEADLAEDAWPPGSIKKLRDDMGLTQQEFADRIGVRQATVSDWEQAKTTPQPMAMRLLDRIARQVYGARESEPDSYPNRPNTADSEVSRVETVSEAGNTSETPPQR